MARWDQTDCVRAYMCVCCMFAFRLSPKDIIDNYASLKCGPRDFVQSLYVWTKRETVAHAQHINILMQQYISAIIILHSGILDHSIDHIYSIYYYVIGEERQPYGIYIAHFDAHKYL